MADETPDPLPNWQPPPPPATTDVPDPLPQRRGVLDTSYQQVPSAANGNAGIEWAPETKRIFAAGQEAYENAPPVITPEARQAMVGTRPADAVGPFFADLLNTGRADLSALGGAAQQFAAEIMSAGKVPEKLQRDLQLGVPLIPAFMGAGGGDVPVGPFVDTPAVRKLMEPPESLGPTPSLTDVAQIVRRQCNAALDAVQPPDPTSQAMIEYLTKRPWDANATPTIPEAPQPSTLTPGPAPAPAPGPGLLNMQPPAPLPTGGLLGKDAPVMSQADMQSLAKGHYSPADEAKANGMRMTPAEGDAIRAPLVNAIPTDPQEAAYFNKTPLADEANLAKDFVGQDMSIGAAMQIDRGLSRAIRATKDATDKANLITAQNGVRDAMEQSPTFQSQPAARQAWSQSIKQGQIEDIEADVMSRDENQQDARRRTLVGNLLRNDTALRSWSPDEVAQLQQQYDQSKIGSLKQFGINMIRPITTAAGAGLGAWMGGPIGGVIVSRIGEQGGDMLTAAARRRAMSIDLTPVSQRLTANMPPPPAGWQGPSQPTGTGWRPVQQGEVFPPGQRFRMNQTTGQSEVYAP
jgi:hypothetical protein